MASVLRFFENNEIFIYLILGILAVWQIRKFTLGWDELRSAAFGLEQESARTRLNWAMSMLVLIFILAVAEFGLVSFVFPNIPEASPLLTPTLDLLATPTITLEAAEQLIETGNTAPSAPIQAEDIGCIPRQVEITFPSNGETVRDVVEIYGTADIPNFGFYKFEMASVNDANWLTIQAGDVAKKDELLGYWDTSRLPVGDYALRLIVTDNQGNASEPCSVQVRVEAPSED
ncbi:MAG: hypothetical protein FJ010_00665 [Chloroflexi bacterium]|nr:hypothetical protein [Chloroflexota bacterium]